MHLSLSHQHYDGVESVEKKMGMQLHTQGTQFGLRELPLEFGGPQFQLCGLGLSFPIIAVDAGRVLYANSGSVNHQVQVKVDGQDGEKRTPKSRSDRKAQPNAGQ